MLEALFSQIACEQPVCSAIDLAIIIAYVFAVTAAIVAVIMFVRRRVSDFRLR